MKVKILRFKIEPHFFTKKLISFFILEGSKNLEIIEITPNYVIFQCELFIRDTKEIIDRFKKNFPTIELVSEKELSMEEWKRLRLSKLEVGKFKFKPIFEKQENEERFIYLDTLFGAFGIDNHPTTIICLEFIDRIEKNYETAVDFGAGNGILSLALSMINIKKIIAIDIFFNYCLEIRQNCKINKISNIFILNGNSMKIVKEVDLLVSNVPLSAFKDKNNSILQSKFKECILSGVKIENKDEFLEIIKTNQIEIKEFAEKEGWLGIKGVKTLN